jgi:hypothetical protein
VTLKLLTISDGNGVDNDFKKWCFYLKLLLSKTHTTLNQSVTGASNEMIFMQLAQAIQQGQIDQAIVQWTIPQRLDVVIDDFWSEQAQNDPDFSFNLVESNDYKWWVSSASKNEYIKQYHDVYIKYWQAHQRSQSYIIAAAELCKSNNIEFVFSLCYGFEFLAPLEKTLRSYPWAWHSTNQGISEFRNQSKYIKYDQGLPQPHSLIQLEWIDQVLRPHCDFIDYDQKTFYNIEQALLKQCSK